MSGREAPEAGFASCPAYDAKPQWHHVWRARFPFNVRTLRLVTGLTLFTYVGTHLLNHSLGNVSIAAMEDGLLIQKWIWQGVLGTTALYTALATHFCLGLWAFYQRRHFGWTRTEVTQLSLGLCIPFLLMNHLFVTRIALAQFGLQKGYAQELYSFWVASPDLGVLQVSVLLVAWTHGCIGVYLWLRLKRFFEPAKAALLCAAILLPVLALLGFIRAAGQCWRCRTTQRGARLTSIHGKSASRPRTLPCCWSATSAC